MNVDQQEIYSVKDTCVQKKPAILSAPCKAPYGTNM